MTTPDTIETARKFAEERLGKTSISSQDRAGFVVNTLLVLYLLSAIRMYESGFASKEDIDRGMILGCAHPMGPLALADLIGLDTLLAISQSLYEFRVRSVAPAVLNRMVEAGLLGRKIGTRVLRLLEEGLIAARRGRASAEDRRVARDLPPGPCRARPDVGQPEDVREVDCLQLATCENGRGSPPCLQTRRCPSPRTRTT